ncbi:MAG: outer membrane protein assembly factor BamD, partial [Myxococcota bacterium]
MSRPIALLRTLLPAAALVLAACASAPPEPELTELEELPEAEDLYREGVTLLEKRRVFLFGWIDLTPYQEAIDKFQEVVDNYPYSQYAVFAELRIADAYYEQERWEEALSYYRDFADLHPEHELVPYTIYRTALCHAAKSPSAGRDQSATKEALEALDQLMSRYPTSAEAREAEP